MKMTTEERERFHKGLMVVLQMACDHGPKTAAWCERTVLGMVEPFVERAFEEGKDFGFVQGYDEAEAQYERTGRFYSNVRQTA